MSDTRFQIFARIASAPYFSKLDALGIIIFAVQFHREGNYVSAFVCMIVLMTISTLLEREIKAINPKPDSTPPPTPE